MMHGQTENLFLRYLLRQLREMKMAELRESQVTGFPDVCDFLPVADIIKRKVMATLNLVKS
jgi:hypothetical protein